MVKTKLKYVIPTFFTCFVQILTGAPEEILVGLERPTSHFGHGTVRKSGVAPAQHTVLPASKLIVAACATSWSLCTCSIDQVTSRVTHLVIFAFHARVTFRHCK
jgi:hypothetical protein